MQPLMRLHYIDHSSDCDVHARSEGVGLILDPGPRRRGNYLVTVFYPRDLVLHDDRLHNHLHRVNQIGFPGHADPCSMVFAATCLSDSALIIVDAAKGVRIQTHAAFVERMRPTTSSSSWSTC